MTPRSIRRAAERKARKEMKRQAGKASQETTQPSLESVLASAREHQRSIPFEDDDNSFTPPPLEFLDPSDPDHIPLFEEFQRLREIHKISDAQLAANRVNAQLSTGPKSPEGKAKASLNAVKTGLTGCTVLLPSDDAAEYQRHIEAFAADYSPVGPREADLVQSIADTWWRLKRIPGLESALFAQGYLEFANAFEEHDVAVRPGLIQAQTFLKYEKQLRNLQLQEARLFRRYEKDRAELRQLQAERQQKEMAALEAAANLYQSAREANQPFDPAAFGFEFSIEQITRHIERTASRKLSSVSLQAGRNSAFTPSIGQAQAA